MESNNKYMKRCLALARLGAGNVAPNPMVGSIIVCRGKIIGEGFHQKYGEAHAEVNAINAVQNPELLQESTLFVTLEPCAHQGLTPPCSDLIVKKQIPRVVIGTVDPFSKVAGRGIEKLRNAGIEVEIGVLEKECRDLNKRFFTFHEKKRPYVILKWAQTLDGFIDVNRGRNEFGEPTWITGDLALRLVHKIRSEESAVLVGTNTAEKDNPSLTVRHWSGKNPTRVLLDKNLRLPQNLNLFDGSVQTLVFNSKKQEQNNQIEWVKIDFEKEITHQILEELHHRKILSVVVEGGKQMLESFISQSLWDEAHIFIGDKFFYDGISAPKIQGILTQSEMLNNDWLKILANPRESN